MIRITEKVRVLVADGKRAVLLRKEAGNGVPRLVVARVYEQENPASREQGTDRPGRTNDSLGRKSTMEATDWHQIAEDQFVKRLAFDLEADLDKGEYEGVIIVAPPVALGELRKVAGASLKQAILAEIDKDLTKHPISEIGKLVAKALEA